MTIKLKNLSDLEDVHNFIFPIVLMRKIISKEQFLLSNTRDMLVFMYSMFFILFIVVLTLSLTSNLQGLYWLAVCLSLIVFLVLFLMIFVRPKLIKRQLKELEGLKSDTPFIILDKEKLEIYNHQGVLLKCFETKNIKDFCYWERNFGKGYLENGFKITFKNTLFDSFVYNETIKERLTDTFYMEYNDELYYVGNRDWLISSVLNMLKKDPHAESFPFRCKNYINQRSWDDP